MNPITIKELPNWRAEYKSGKDVNGEGFVGYNIFNNKHYIGFYYLHKKTAVIDYDIRTTEAKIGCPNIRQAMLWMFLKTQKSFTIAHNAEKRVMKKYPKAKCIRDGALFFISVGKRDLGAGFSQDGAWCSAGCTLNEE